MKCLLSEKGAPGFAVGETEFLISEVLSTPESGDRWAGYSSAQDLWERASADELAFRFEAVAPVVFKQGDLNLPLPLPLLFYKGLLLKWNKSYPHLNLSEWIGEFIDRWVSLMEFRIRTEVWEDNRVKYHGFIGRFSFYASKKVPPEKVKAINLLSDFAFYAGVGAKTTMSLGMVRRI
jgi:CRISPR-associated endoribonuclease Cas6